MKIVSNDLEGKYACPDHPITCINPAPWEITEVKIVRDYDRDTSSMMWKVFIRNEGSCWFRADQCFISDKEDCETHLGFLETKEPCTKCGKQLNDEVHCVTCGKFDHPFYRPDGTTSVGNGSIA